MAVDNSKDNDDVSEVKSGHALPDWVAEHLSAAQIDVLRERFVDAGPSSSLTIRRVGVEDCPDWRDLMLAGFANDPTAFLSTVADREPLPLTWWENRITGADGMASIVMGAWSGDTMVGVVGALPGDRARTAHKATIFGMVVAADQRNLGLGRLLMRRLLDELPRATTVRVVQLTVTEGNEAAERLYRSLGFETFGLEPKAMKVGDDFLAKVHLWKQLDRNGNAS